MKLVIQRQETYSKLKLLLKGFFGIIYIAVPHCFVLLFFSIFSIILKVPSFVVVLLTKKYPKKIFNFHVKLLQWRLRVAASLSNLIEEYPAFGINGRNDKITLDVEYPEDLSRSLVLARFLFGPFFIWVPHIFCLVFRITATFLIIISAWWVILFKGYFPEKWFDFIAGTFRWMTRVSLYSSIMTDDFPPFSGKED
jgi:hypothetical protein